MFFIRALCLKEEMKMSKHSRHSKSIMETIRTKKTNKSYNNRNFKQSNAKRKMPGYQKILLIIFIIIFIYSGVTLLKWYINTGDSEKKYQDLAQEVEISNESSSEENKNIIDFEKLKSINSDVVGWIKIDKTNINYPIMQSTDNNYYLTKNFYNEYDRSGSVFLDYKNQKNFTDKNMVIYGHNIKRGTVFADLVDLCKGNFGKDIAIYIYTEEKTMEFKVFSSYEIEPEDYSINSKISEGEFEQFKQTILKRSQIDFDGNAEGGNQILTLSTCDNSGKKRIIVHAVLESVQ
jgi:sortase B